MGEHIVPTLIYCGSISLLTVIVFGIFRVYRMLTKDIGMMECIKIVLLAAGVSITGFIALVFIPYLPPAGKYVWTALLAVTTKLFAFPAIRIVVRFINLLTSIFEIYTKVILHPF